MPSKRNNDEERVARIDHLVEGIPGAREEGQRQS